MKRRITRHLEPDLWQEIPVLPREVAQARSRAPRCDLLRLRDDYLAPLAILSTIALTAAIWRPVLVA